MRKGYLVSIILLLLTSVLSCVKNPNERNPNLKVFGHGGMGIGKSYPMNSMESILAALNLGADGTEIDVQMTKDGRLVAYHNEYLNGSTTLTGRVYEHEYASFRTACYTNFPLGVYALLTVEDLIKGIKNPQRFVFTFDCKLYAAPTDGFMDSFKQAITSLALKYNLQNNIFIESQSPVFLNAMQGTGFPLFIYPGNFTEGLEIAKNLNLYGITISTDHLTRANVLEAHDNNVKITTWNTQSKRDNLEAVNKGVDYIQTDKLQHLIRLTD